MRFIPPAILVAAAAFLAIRWETLPERWVIHWGPGGVPDAYASKTPVGVFGPLLFVAVIALVLDRVAAYTERIAANAQFPRLTRAYGNLVRWVAIGETGALATTVLLLPSATPPSPRLIIGVILGAVVLGLVAGGMGISAAWRQTAAAGESLPKGYGPFLYRNPEDPRLVVPKLVGAGWTLNFARPAAWILMGLVLLPAIGALVAAILTTR